MAILSDDPLDTSCLPWGPRRHCDPSLWPYEDVDGEGEQDGHTDRQAQALPDAWAAMAAPPARTKPSDSGRAAISAATRSWSGPSATTR
jgi:hypothetical protein